MANFGIHCLAKNKKPACDEYVDSGEILSSLTQAVMYAELAPGTGSPFVDIPVNVVDNDTPFEFGSDAGADFEFTLARPSAGMTLENAAAPGSFPARIAVPLSGVYHFDIDVIYRYQTSDDPTDRLSVGPGVNGVVDLGPPIFENIISKNYGNIRDRSRYIHVSGNINLNSSDEISVFYQYNIGGAPTSLEVGGVRLRIFRVGPVIN